MTFGFWGDSCHCCRMRLPQAIDKLKTWRGHFFLALPLFSCLLPSLSLSLCHTRHTDSYCDTCLPCRQLTTLGITVNSWLDNCNATDAAAAIVLGLFSDRCDLHKLCEGAIMRYIFQRRGQIAVNRQSDWLTSGLSDCLDRMPSAKRKLITLRRLSWRLLN